jgi:hypothetical protein
MLTKSSKSKTTRIHFKLKSLLYNNPSIKFPQFKHVESKISMVKELRASKLTKVSKLIIRISKLEILIQFNLMRSIIKRLGLDKA